MINMPCSASPLSIQTINYSNCCENRWGLTCCLQVDMDSTHHCVQERSLPQTPMPDLDATFTLKALLKSVKYIWWLCCHISYIFLIIFLLELLPLIQVWFCRVKTDLCVLILFPGCRLTRLSCHGTLFSVFFLDHNENKPENQRKRKLQVHRYPRYLRLRELWGDCKFFVHILLYI